MVVSKQSGEGSMQQTNMKLMALPRRAGRMDVVFFFVNEQATQFGQDFDT